jgi:hypothetical protein
LATHGLEKFDGNLPVLAGAVQPLFGRGAIADTKFFH